MSLLKQDINRKRQVNKLDPELELGIGNDKEYKLMTIRNGAIYANKTVKSPRSELYYLVS